MVKSKTMQVDWELCQSLTSDGLGVRGVGIVDLENGGTQDDAEKDGRIDTFKLFTGTQGGTLFEFGVPSASLEAWQYQHDGGVAAVCCSQSEQHHVMTGCKDSKIRVLNSTTRQLLHTLEGHDKPVTSLACVDDWLVSGSWDGTAKLWNWKTKALIATLPDHENSVCVAIVGRPSSDTDTSTSTLRIITGSAGKSQNNQVRDHTVRSWNVNLITGQVLKTYQVANDHEGPIRDVCIFSLKQGDGETLATCSNDGTVKLRSFQTGVCTSTLTFLQQQQQHPPMLLSLCCTTDGCLIASAEDGHVIAWDLDAGGEPQILMHSSCVWRVEPLSNGDFCTASDDGTVRVFTRATERMASKEEREAFAEEGLAAVAKKQGGPSSEEIAKLPFWERNFDKRGKSEGQVQLFQKNGIAIAAQWSMASQTWIEVGEVTGSAGNSGGDGNAGEIEGVRYDHVLPVELENAGSVANLRIGYNNGENPFTAAQRFIDAHMLPQSHLSQIADYIQQRTGANATPMLGAAGSQPTAATTGIPMVSFQHIPIKHYLAFELPSSSSVMEKMKTKLVDFNQLSEEEIARVSALMETVKATNRYHSSKVTELSIIEDMLKRLDASQSFVALDLARFTVLHPNAAEQADALWTDIFVKAMALMQTPPSQLEDGPAANAIPMLSLRLFANALKGGSHSRKAMLALSESILTQCVTPHIASTNKNIRLAVATLFYNMAYCGTHTKAGTSGGDIPIPTLIDLIGQVLSNHELFEEAAVMRTLQALGTLCSTFPEAKEAANALFLASKVEPAASRHSADVKVAATEVYNLLQ